jgi:hypothetical protein
VPVTGWTIPPSTGGGVIIPGFPAPPLVSSGWPGALDTHPPRTTPAPPANMTNENPTRIESIRMLRLTSPF